MKTMKILRLPSFLRRASLVTGMAFGFVLLASFALLPTACTNTDGGTEFEIAYVDRDNLASFDSIVVLLQKDGSAKTDTLFKGKLTDTTILRHLKVPGDLQGTVAITVQGFNNGDLALERHTTVDVDKGAVAGTELLHSAQGKIRFASSSLKMKIGDTAAMPALNIEPTEWKDKDITFSFQEIKVLALIAKNRLVGLARGSARVVATLVSDSTVTDTLFVQVVDPEADKISVRVSPDTLRLTALGASLSLNAETTPLYSPLAWSSADDSVATVDANGLVRGWKVGKTWVRARSTTDSTGADSSWIVVSGAVPVESVRFARPTLSLFVGGAADSVSVQVLPLDANPATGLRLLGKAVTLSGRRFTPVDTGSALAIAYSLLDTTKTDTLRINVKQAVTIQSFRLKPDTLRLYLGGPDSAFSLVVDPVSAGQGAVWHVAKAGIAKVSDSGVVKAIGEGQVFVAAQALADSSKRDTSLIQVVRDLPKLSVGNAVVTAPGSTVEFAPKVEQEFGGVTRFWWDLDGNDVWDDSSDGLKTLTRKFDEVGETVAHFKVRDLEGNEGLAERKVTITKGPLVVILDPPDGFVTNKKTVEVNWEVDHVKQDKQTQEQLTQEGPKTIVRSAKDAAGNETVISITIFLDTKAPERPLVSAVSPTNTKTPNFGWRSGGGKGAGIYRYQIDAEPGANQSETGDTTLTWPADLNAGSHTLFVQERDVAGNWSASGSAKVVIDFTAPPAPTVKAVSGANSTDLKVTFVWQGAEEGALRYRYQIDKEKFEGGAVELADTTVTVELTEGHHAFYVQQLDSAGNASTPGKALVNVDVTAPGKPSLRSLTGLWSTNGKPTWIWKTGGGAGSGQFRTRLDTADLSGKSFNTDTLFTPAAVLGEGPHRLFVQERDSVGNVSPVESLTVTVDTQVPSAPICLEPADNAWVNTLRPTWKWKGGGGGDGRYYASIATAPTPDTSTRITDTILTPTANLTEGQKILMVKAYDAAGNVSPLTTCRLRIDVTAPAKPVTDTSNHFYVTSVSPTRLWSRVGGGAGIYRVKLDDSSLTSGTTSVVGTGKWTAPAPLPEGNHYLGVQEMDSAGNASPSLILPFKIDTTAPAAPVITLVQPGPAVSCPSEVATIWNYQVAADAKTNYYQIDSAALPSPVASPVSITSYQVPTSPCIAEGAHSFHIRTVDSAGLSSPIASSTVRFITRQEATGVTGSEASGLNLGIYSSVYYLGFISGKGVVNVLTAKEVGDALQNSGTLSTIVSPNYMRMAIGPKGEVGIIDGIVSSEGNGKDFELFVYNSRSKYPVALPKWSSYPNWFALDFDAEGNLFLAYNDVDNEGRLSICMAATPTSGRAACEVQVQGISSPGAKHIFMTARPAVLVSLVTANGYPEVYGQTSVAETKSYPQVETGLEKTPINHFGLGFVKNTAALMSFSPTESPYFQTLSFRNLTGWTAGKLQTTPAALGKGMGLMDIDGSGRPYVVLGGKMWGYSGGNWYSVSTNGHDFSATPMLDLKVREDGTPLLFYSTGSAGGLNANLLRTGFELPATQAK